MNLSVIGWLNDPRSASDGIGRHMRAVQRTMGVPAYDLHDAARWSPEERSERAQDSLVIQFDSMTGLVKRPLRLPGRQWFFGMYELDRLPAGAADELNRFERVLVPCEWCVEVFRANGVTVPISMVPEGIDPEECPFQLPDTTRPFTFLCLGDRGRRKAFDLVIMAFQRTFGTDPDVQLIVKTRKGGLSYLEGDRYAENIRIWREDVPNIADIYRQCDCLVFPSCGEGWGLPPREAAAMGLPTIVSAHTGLLVGIESYATRILREQTLATTDYDGGARWYRASVDEIGKLMAMTLDFQHEARHRAYDNALWLRRHQTIWQARDALLDVLDSTLVRS